MRPWSSILALVVFAPALLLHLGCTKDAARPTALFADAAVDSMSPVVLPLWPGGAPGSETRRNEPEESGDYWVKNIHNPSLACFFPPDGKASGTAIVIVPGGGHRELVFEAEGAEPARYLAGHGVIACALKYRLSREERSIYDLEKHSAADIQRAMRRVRAHAGEWNLDRDRVGVMGWSAGAELAAVIAYRPVTGDPSSPDPDERVSARPDFQIVIYPGPYGIPDQVPPEAPPAFFLAANDDVGASANIIELLQKYRRAGVPVEVHLYSEGHHAFNMGNRSTLVSIKSWPQRMVDWLTDRGLLTRARAGH